MKKHFIKALLVAVIATSGILVSAFSPQDDYTTNCLIVKKKGFGTGTYDRTKYTVTLENTCERDMDIQISIKKNEGRWDSGVKWNVGFRETFTWYSSNSKGYFKYWAKPAGSSLKFPRESEITD